MKKIISIGGLNIEFTTIRQGKKKILIYFNDTLIGSTDENFIVYFAYKENDIMYYNIEKSKY